MNYKQYPPMAYPCNKLLDKFMYCARNNLSGQDSRGAFGEQQTTTYDDMHTCMEAQYQDVQLNKDDIPVYYKDVFKDCLQCSADATSNMVTPEQLQWMTPEELKEVLKHEI